MKKINYIFIFAFILVVPFISSKITLPSNSNQWWSVQSIDSNESRYYDVFINGDQLILMKRFIGTAILDNEVYVQPTRIRYRDSFGNDTLLNINAISDRLIYNVPSNRRPEWIKFGENSIVLVGTTSYNATLSNISNHTGFVHLNTSDFPNIRYHYTFDVLQNNGYFENWANNGQNYTLQNATTQGPAWNSTGGYFGAGFTFNGVNNSLRSVVAYGQGGAGGSPPFQNGTFNLTVSARIKMNPNGTFQTIGAGVNSFYDNHGFMSYRLSIMNDSAYFQIGRDGTFHTHVTGTTKLNDSQWHFILGTYNHSNLSIYVDGVLENRTRETNTYWSNTATPNICVGGDAFNCLGVQTGLFPPPGFFNGTIDDVELRTSWMNDSEVLDFYNNISNRFKVFGTMNFTNINFTGNNTVNISLQACQTHVNTTIQASFNNANYRNFVNCQITGYSVPTDENNSYLTIRLLAGPNANNPFYTPAVIQNITLDSYFIPVIPPAGNLTCGSFLMYDNPKVPITTRWMCPNSQMIYNQRFIRQ